MTKQTLIVLASSLVLLAGGTFYFLYASDRIFSDQQSVGRIDDTKKTKGKVKDSNIVAIFSQTPVPVNAITTPDPESEATPIKITLPVGWQNVSSDKKENSDCDSSVPQTITRFEKAEESITIYENATPAGCDNKIVGDVNLNFVYKNDGSIEVEKLPSYTQCSKDQNSSCPKGDGRVTVFITSYDNSTQKQIKNPLNNAAYAFRIDDTKLDVDFNAQVSELASLIEQIKFTY